MTEFVGWRQAARGVKRAGGIRPTIETMERRLMLSADVLPSLAVTHSHYLATQVDDRGSSPRKVAGNGLARSAELDGKVASVLDERRGRVQPSKEPHAGASLVSSGQDQPAANVATAALPNTTTGTLSVDTADGHPPGLPMGAEWDLGTRWTAIVSATSPVTALATAGDGTLWAGAAASGRPANLYTYDPATGALTLIWVTSGPASITSIAAISANSAWVVVNTGAAYEISDTDGTVSVTAVPALPSNDTFAQISAGSDGTTWAVGTSGNPYSYSSTTNSWTMQLNGGASLFAISVGSATNIWALGRIGDDPPFVLHFLYGDFQADPYFVSKGGANLISASADGTVWAVSTNGTLYSRPADLGAWSPVTNETPPGTIAAISGVSQYRMYASIAGIGLSLLSYGLADQPATGFPAMDAGETLGYEAISQAVKVTNPGGIRAEYTNASEPFSDWYTKVSLMANPPNVPPADWTAIQSQIETELLDVRHVYKIFHKLAKVNTAVEANVGLILPAVKTAVETSTKRDGDSDVVVLLEGVFEAALWGIAAAGLPVGGAVVASMLASGYGSVISVLTGNPEPTSNTQVDLKYAELAQEMVTLFEDTAKVNPTYEASILSDWGRLNAFANANIAWPVTSSSKIAAHTTTGFETYFYQTLMPVKWQVVYFSDFDEFYPNEIDPRPYDLVQVVIGHDFDNNPVVNLWFIHDKNGDDGPYSYAGPYPTRGLLKLIYGLGVTKNELVTGANGWLPVVQKS